MKDELKSKSRPLLLQQWKQKTQSQVEQADAVVSLDWTVNAGSGLKSQIIESDMSDK